MKKKKAVQLDANKVMPLLKRFRWKLPNNVDRRVLDRFHFGKYYGYGAKDLWIPITVHGGIATKAFHTKTVKFPKPIEKLLQAMLETEDAF
jgi:hypothetical protein